MGGRLHGLDALRGIAAICVVITHGSQELLPLGFLAVDLFLMLSGFVMARTYESRLRENDLGTRKFIALRYRRLLPAYALGCAIGIPLYLANDWPLWGIAAAATAALLFLPTPFGPHLYPLNPPGWSLTFELAANALHARFLARMSDKALLVVLAVLVTAFAGILSYQGDVVAGHVLNGFPQTLARCLAAYVIGILLFRNRHLAPSLSPIWALSAFPALIVAGVILPKTTFVVVFVLLLCPALILIASREVALPAFWTYLGAISYPLYTTHYMAGEWALWLGYPALLGGAASFAAVSAYWLTLPKFLQLRLMVPHSARRT